MPEPLIVLGAAALIFVIADNVIHELRERRARKTLHR
jgi:hypothetical protein